MGGVKNGLTATLSDVRMYKNCAVRGLRKSKPANPDNRSQAIVYRLIYPVGLVAGLAFLAG
jgi:hypothetical protein